MAMAGVNLKSIMELLGHKSLKMVLRYSHLAPEHKKLKIRLLDTNLIENESKEEIRPTPIPKQSPNQNSSQNRQTSVPGSNRRRT